MMNKYESNSLYKGLYKVLGEFISEDEVNQISQGIYVFAKHCIESLPTDKHKGFEPHLVEVPVLEYSNILNKLNQRNIQSLDINLWRYFKFPNSMEFISFHKDLQSIIGSTNLDYNLNLENRLFSQSASNTIEQLIISGMKNNNDVGLYVRKHMNYNYIFPSGKPAFNEFHIEINYDQQNVIGIKSPYECDWFKVNKDLDYAEDVSDLLFIEKMYHELEYNFTVNLRQLEELAKELLELDLKGTVVYNVTLCNKRSFYLIDVAESLDEALSKGLNATRKGE